jgi:hypothetical protein
MAGLIVMFSAADSNDSTAGTIMLITLGDSWEQRYYISCPVLLIENLLNCDAQIHQFIACYWENSNTFPSKTNRERQEIKFKDKCTSISDMHTPFQYQIRRMLVKSWTH